MTKGVYFPSNLFHSNDKIHFAIDPLTTGRIIMYAYVLPTMGSISYIFVNNANKCLAKKIAKWKQSRVCGKSLPMKQ